VSRSNAFESVAGVSVEPTALSGVPLRDFVGSGPEEEVECAEQFGDDFDCDGDDVESFGKRAAGFEIVIDKIEHVIETFPSQS
jgi:hypothetical protein